jgi:hypothetical protein
MALERNGASSNPGTTIHSFGIMASALPLGWLVALSLLVVEVLR